MKTTNSTLTQMARESLHTSKYCQILRRYKRINPLLFIKTKKPHPKDAVFIYKIVFAISMQ